MTIASKILNVELHQCPSRKEGLNHEIVVGSQAQTFCVHCNATWGELDRKVRGL